MFTQRRVTWLEYEQWRYLFIGKAVSLSFFLSFLVFFLVGVSDPARWNGEDLRISLMLGMALSDEEPAISAPSSSVWFDLKKCVELDRLSGEIEFGLYSSTNAFTNRENMCGAIAGSAACG